jgi:Protein of unknown function (DUF3073)
MGRGRAKAKQTKVARELKYNSGGTDLERLRQELVGSPGSTDAPTDDVADEVDEADDEYDDPYADRYGDADDDSEDGRAGGRSA